VYPQVAGVIDEAHLEEPVHKVAGQGGRRLIDCSRFWF
jgi:hypothetical protein